MRRQHVERLVLDLVGTERTPDANSLARLSHSDWTRVGEIAALHRLGPWFHHLHGGRKAIPAWLRSNWEEGYRQSALAALVLKADLMECFALLRDEGFAPLALKGAVLAWQCYPEPALRPMRDIDLLLPKEQVLEVYRTLLTANYAPDSPCRLPLEDVVRLEKHLPPLLSRRGTVIELHMRLNEHDGRLEYATPDSGEAEIIRRAVAMDGMSCPTPEDMLAHLVVHAIYGHRLDCGPLVLVDIYQLVRSTPLDWDFFWSIAQAGGWSEGADLLFALVRDQFGDGAIPAGIHPVEQPMLDLACALLCQDFREKKAARTLSLLLALRFDQLRLLAGGIVRNRNDTGVKIDRAAEGGYGIWTVRQAAALSGAMTKPGIWRQSFQLRQYHRWLKDKALH